MEFVEWFLCEAVDAMFCLWLVARNAKKNVRERMSERMPNNMSMSKDMPERMSEDTVEAPSCGP